MSTIRVAHFSDTHVLSLDGIGPRRFLNKRWTGAVNLALNRSKHYRVEVFEQLLTAIAVLEPDHTLCTGDLVNLALEPEFVRVAEMLEQVFTADTLTVVPGNHDYYVREAVRDGLFERSFGQFQPHDLGSGVPYPVTRIQDGLAVIGLNSAIPTPVFMATGRLCAAQLDRMESALRACAGKFRVLMLHHPLLPDPTRRLEHTRRLIDAQVLIERLQSLGDLAPDLVIHGHNHAFIKQAVPGTTIPIVQVASASRAASQRRRAEFNVFVITGGELVAIERHIHEPITGHFIPHDEAGRPLMHKAS